MNARDDLGNTALHYAAKSGLRKCLEYLVAHDADLYAKNMEGDTAIDVALRHSHHYAAQFLDSKMASANPGEADVKLPLRDKEC